MPYIKNAQVFTCPSDADPALSQDLNDAKTIKRSYIAIRAAEGLHLSQIEVPVETIVICDKWDKTADPTHAAITDSWIEPFNGDFDYYPTFKRMALAGDRHHGGVELRVLRRSCQMAQGTDYRGQQNSDRLQSYQRVSHCGHVR